MLLLSRYVILLPDVIMWYVSGWFFLVALSGSCGVKAPMSCTPPNYGARFGVVLAFLFIVYSNLSLLPHTAWVVEFLNEGLELWYSCSQIQIATFPYVVTAEHPPILWIGSEMEAGFSFFSFGYHRTCGCDMCFARKCTCLSKSICDFWCILHSLCLSQWSLLDLSYE